MLLVLFLQLPCHLRQLWILFTRILKVTWQSAGLVLLSSASKISVWLLRVWSGRVLCLPKAQGTGKCFPDWKGPVPVEVILRCNQAFPMPISIPCSSSSSNKSSRIIGKSIRILGNLTILLLLRMASITVETAFSRIIVINNKQVEGPGKYSVGGFKHT